MGLKMNTKLKNNKPDFDIAARRMEAYWQGEMLDRPIIMASTSKKNYDFVKYSTYHDRAVSGDLEQILKNMLHNARGINYLGEMMPSAWMSFGTHEISSFFGSKIIWTDGSGDTTWTNPIVLDWDEFLPLHFPEGNSYWQRMLKFYEKSAEIFDGEVLPISIDFHSNMDLLLSLRGDEQLSYDVYDCPEKIDAAMEGAKLTFKHIWEAVEKAAKMKEYGYWYEGYSEKRTCVLACDYICMISPEMLRRWFIPTFEYEASLIDNVVFHWDGPGALRHFNDIMAIDKIHTIAYVPNPYEKHKDYMELYKKVQENGKAVLYHGSIDEIKSVFYELNPAKTLYKLTSATEKEFYDFEKWVKNNV